MSADVIDIEFEGFFLCRLATDPDPSLEDRGISGFTFAVAGESLLDPRIFCQAKDVRALHGTKDPRFLTRKRGGAGGGAYSADLDIKNIREASPDYERYNREGIGLRVTRVSLDGRPHEGLTSRLGGSLVRFRSREVPGAKPRYPSFEGRNQIVSDGDPDRFTVNPFVLQVSRERENDPDGPEHVLVQRFDPLLVDDPDRALWNIANAEDYEQRLPCQRFPTSNELLRQLGIEDAEQHFVNRGLWLREKIAEAEASGKIALAEAYRSRLFGVEFFTRATGPTVLSNRLASRIPLRQLYVHEIRGTDAMSPGIVVDDAAFDPGDGRDLRVDRDLPWPVQYYIGAFDGDLMTGFIDGRVTLPFHERRT